MGSSLLVLLALAAYGQPQADVVLERTVGSDAPAQGMLYLSGLTADAGTKVEFVQTSPLCDDQRCYGAAVTAPAFTVTGPVATMGFAVGGAEVPPGVSTARGRLLGVGASPRDVTVQVHTRSSSWWLYLAVLLGAAVQLVQRLVRPQVDAVAEVRPAVDDLGRALDRQRAKQDATLQAALGEISLRLSRALKLFAHPTRQGRIDAVAAARADLVAAVEGLETRRAAFVERWGATLATAGTAWRLPDPEAAALRAHAQRIRGLLDAWDVEGAGAGIEALSSGLDALVKGALDWRDAVRASLTALQTECAPLASARVDARCREALEALDAAPLADRSVTEPAALLLAADRAAAAVGRAVRAGADVVGGIVRQGKDRDLDDVLASLASGDLRTPEAVDALAGAARTLSTRLEGSNESVAAPTGDDTEGAPPATDPSTPTEPKAGTPSAIPEWGFDSSSALGVAVEIATAIPLLLFLAWLVWGESWHGTRAEIGAAFAFGLGTNLALSALLPLFYERAGATRAPSRPEVALVADED